MFFHKLLFVIAIYAISFGTSTTLQAQLQGVVRDTRGQPVPEARVELWNELKRLGVHQTGPAGEFAFPEELGDSATGVIASRIGYATQTVSLQSRGESLAITLPAAPLGLDGIIVRGSPRALCPNRDDPAAHALVAAAAARYSSPDSLYIGSSSVRMLNEVIWADVGIVDDARLEVSARGTGPQRRYVGPALGYGFRIDGSWRPEFAGWEYKEFGSHFAQHFLDPSFGTYNSLSIRGPTQEGTVIAFCSRNLGRRAVGIEGTLTVSPESTIVSATWRFRTPPPEESAGGEVTFVPHPGGTQTPWLVPASSLYWRAIHGSNNRFVQLWERFDRWTVSTGAPKRRGVGSNPAAPR